MGADGCSRRSGREIAKTGRVLANINRWLYRISRCHFSGLWEKYLYSIYMGRAKCKEVLRWEANLYQIEEFAHTETVAPALGRYTIFCCEESPLLARVGEVIRIAQDQLERRVVVVSNRQTWENLQNQGLHCPHIIVPGNEKVSEPILQSIAIQILPFYIARRLGIDPDTILRCGKWREKQHL